jgi:hypothetical protein
VTRDIAVKVLLSAEEYVGLERLADDAGLSHSAVIRQLLKRAIAAHVHSVLAAQAPASAGTAQD